METLKDIRPMLFSKRLKIEKEFLEYAGKNHIVNAPMNVIAFINKDIVFKEDLKSKAIEWIKDQRSIRRIIFSRDHKIRGRQNKGPTDHYSVQIKDRIF